MASRICPACGEIPRGRSTSTRCHACGRVALRSRICGACGTDNPVDPCGLHYNYWMLLALATGLATALALALGAVIVVV